MFGRRKSPRLPGRIDTLVGRGTTLRGDLEFSGGVHVDGVLQGDARGIEASMPSTLWVGEPGQIKGNVEVAIAVVNGEVVGNVRGTQRVVLGAKARVTGDVSYGVIEMALGARIEGRLMPLAGGSAATGAASGAGAGAAVAAGALPAPETRPDNVLRPFDQKQNRI